MFWNKKYKIKEKELNSIIKEMEASRNEYDDYLKSSKSAFLSRLIIEIGDLIHYQSGDYKKDFPKDSKVYNHIGTILRSMYNPERNYMTVGEIIEKENSHIQTAIPKEILDPIKDFNAFMLVDLTSRMQGITKDDSFFDALSFFEELK